jgi:BirA family biotin operon repressor/biotin-[acetyl-CoA-carboxylase] ligase
MSSPADSQALTPETIRAVLHTKSFGRTLHILHETPSTNTAAMALAQKGAEHGTVVVAERQTAGRGRLGRSWYSPAGENLYCSVIVRQTASQTRLAEWLSWLPLLSAVASARAIQAVAALQARLKWPNDILIGQRKLGGVLCESNGSRTQGRFVVVGIGINVNTPRNAFPDDLRDLATSLAAEAGHSCDRVALLATLLSELENCIENLSAQQSADLKREYTKLCSTLGRQVRVSLASGESVAGQADAINPDGSLRIIRNGANTGTILDLRAGDVIHIR